MTVSTLHSGDRRRHINTAIRLEYLTIGWNVVEGIIAVAAALAAGSVALLGFGIDSFVESASGAILLWRLLVERRGEDPAAVAALDRRAHRMVAASLFLLAVYVAFDATTSLYAREIPKPSTIGIILTIISIGVMLWLGRAKRRVAAALQSRALEADAFQTTACWWLSVAALAGLVLNATVGWWWADPVAALVMAGIIAREGWSAWRGDDCC